MANAKVELTVRNTVLNDHELIFNYFENHIDVYFNDELKEFDGFTTNDYGITKTVYSGSFEYSPPEYDDYGREKAGTGSPAQVEIKLVPKNGMKFTNNDITTNDNKIIFTGNEYEKVLQLSVAMSTNVMPKDFSMIVDESQNANLPFSYIYDVDIEKLNDLKKFAYYEREVINANGDTTETLVNYGKYITSLYAFPFDISGNDEVDILLGDINTSVTANQIENYIHDENLGTIVIPKELSNGVGYKNITIDLYVPYFGNINLDVDEVLGSTIELNIKTNIISGKGTLNVKSLETNSTIYSEQKQLGVKVPYELSDTINVNIGSDVLETDYTKPYLEVKVLKPDNMAKLDDINKISLDKDFNYIKDGDDLIFSTIATEREQKLIKDMVARGVFLRK